MFKNACNVPVHYVHFTLIEKMTNLCTRMIIKNHSNVNFFIGAIVYTSAIPVCMFSFVCLFVFFWCACQGTYTGINIKNKAY